MDDYQFTWYDKYLNKNDDYDDKLINELINKLNNNNQKTVQNKVIQLETEYHIKLKEI